MTRAKNTRDTKDADTPHAPDQGEDREPSQAPAPSEHPPAPRTGAHPGGQAPTPSEHQGAPESPRAHGRQGHRALWWGLAVMVLAACLPVLAQLAPSGAATLMWLASMPLCLAGAAVAGRSTLRLVAARRADQDDDLLL